MVGHVDCDQRDRSCETSPGGTFAFFSVVLGLVGVLVVGGGWAVAIRAAWVVFATLAMLDIWIFYFNLSSVWRTRTPLPGCCCSPSPFTAICITVAARWSFAARDLGPSSGPRPARPAARYPRSGCSWRRTPRLTAVPQRERHFQHGGRIRGHRRADPRRAGGDDGQRIHQVRGGHHAMRKLRRRSARAEYADNIRAGRPHHDGAPTTPAIRSGRRQRLRQGPPTTTRVRVDRLPAQSVTGHRTPDAPSEPGIGRQESTTQAIRPARHSRRRTRRGCPAAPIPVAVPARTGCRMTPSRLQTSSSCQPWLAVQVSRTAPVDAVRWRSPSRSDAAPAGSRWRGRGGQRPSLYRADSAAEASTTITARPVPRRDPPPRQQPGTRDLAAYRSSR